MQSGTLFWFLMILWALCMLGAIFLTVGSAYFGVGGQVLHWVLLALLGWKVFGPVLRNG